MLIRLTGMIRAGLGGAMVAIVAALLALMTAQIVLRYGFNASLLWVEEVCRYLLIWLTFIAAVFALERGEVAALSLLGEMLPPRPALVVAILATLASAAFCLLLARYGWIFAERAGGAPIPAFGFLFADLFGPAAPAAPTTFWVYVALPFGAGLMALRLIADAVLLARALPAGLRPEAALARQGGGSAA